MDSILTNFSSGKNHQQQEHKPGSVDCIADHMLPHLLAVFFHVRFSVFDN